MTETEKRLLKYLKGINNHNKKAVLQSIALFLGYSHRKARKDKIAKYHRDFIATLNNIMDGDA